MSRKPNRLGMYADIQPILDAVLRTNGGIYELPTHKQAVYWRLRAYKFRKLYAEILGQNKLSKYDKILFPRIPAGSCRVEMRLLNKTPGRFIPNEEVDENFHKLDVSEDYDAPTPEELIAQELAKQIDEGELE